MSRRVKIDHWDSMYQLPLDKIPWEITAPPIELVELVESGQLHGGTALDIGCGTGNYSFYLARQGFNVVGVDFSEKALAIARKHNEALNLSVRFEVSDVTDMEAVFKPESFDFILDYSILHHVELELTDRYVRQIVRVLKPDGRLLLVCYSDKDRIAEGKTIATSKYGNTMFYRSDREIRASYRILHELSYKEVRLGRRAQHRAHCFLFQKTIL